MENERSLESVPDDALLLRLARLLRESRHAEADLVAHIGEVDVRRLYAREAAPSMFAYCTERLHLSEAEAYLRITAARASRAHPVLLDMLADGRLHLSSVARLAPHLTAENRDAVLTRATHKSKREILELVAELAPRPDAPSSIRRLPERIAMASRPQRVLRTELAACSLLPGAPGAERDRAQLCPDRVVRGSSQATVEALAPGRYKVQFTATAELRDKLERLRGLMRSVVPDGDVAALIEDAVTEKLRRLEARRFGRTKVPRRTVAKSEAKPASRHVPAAVRRAVAERDGHRCRYVDATGRRCTAREGLEFHHRHPYGHGGDCSVENICLMCRAHNALIAEVDYGHCAPGRHRHSGVALGGTSAVRQPSDPHRGPGARTGG